MIFKTLAVVGAGTMGNGIAQVAAVAGLHVVVTDVNETALSKGLSTLTANLGRLVDKGKLDAASRDSALPVSKLPLTISASRLQTSLSKQQPRTLI
ncbi:3-hydroxyacyl-CoA dehydrogenase [Paraburkholderia youngii]